MRNIALFLTYEGTAYHGWQMQKNLPTIQETMEKAIAMVVVIASMSPAAAERTQVSMPSAM